MLVSLTDDNTAIIKPISVSYMRNKKQCAKILYFSLEELSGAFTGSKY